MKRLLPRSSNPWNQDMIHFLIPIRPNIIIQIDFVRITLKAKSKNIYAIEKTNQTCSIRLSFKIIVFVLTDLIEFILTWIWRKITLQNLTTVTSRVGRSIWLEFELKAVIQVIGRYFVNQLIFLDSNFIANNEVRIFFIAVIVVTWTTMRAINLNYM